MSCLDQTTNPVCITAADGTKASGVAHYSYDSTGVLVRTVITDAEGTALDTAGSTVSAGSCPIPAPDVEWTTQCDKQADGTVVMFTCQVITSFDDAGAPIVPALVANYEIDKVTPYTPTGTVGDCSEDCPPVAPVGVVTAWDALG